MKAAAANDDAWAALLVAHANVNDHEHVDRGGRSRSRSPRSRSRSPLRDSDLNHKSDIYVGTIDDDHSTSPLTSSDVDGFNRLDSRNNVDDVFLLPQLESPWMKPPPYLQDQPVAIREPIPVAVRPTIVQNGTYFISILRYYCVYFTTYSHTYIR